MILSIRYFKSILFTDWRRTARSIVLQKILFYFIIFIFFLSFLKFIFEPKPLFFQIRIQNLLGVHPLSFSKILLVSEKKNKMSLFRRIFQIFRKS